MAEQKIFIADKPTLDITKANTDMILSTLEQGGMTYSPLSQIVIGSIQLRSSSGRKIIAEIEGSGCLHGALFFSDQSSGGTPTAYVYVDDEYVFKTTIPKTGEGVTGIAKRSAILPNADPTTSCIPTAFSDTIFGIKNIPNFKTFPNTEDNGLGLIDGPICFSKNLRIEIGVSGTTMVTNYYDIQLEVF